MEVRLRSIDRSTWETCCTLRVSEAQARFVAPNAYSLAQAAYEPDLYPTGIFYEGELVGFLMWDFDGDLRQWELCRLMVDELYQGQGIGAAAVRVLLELVRAKIGPVKFYTSAEPENMHAIAFFEELGFRQNGRVVYGETQLEIQL